MAQIHLENVTRRYPRAAQTDTARQTRLDETVHDATGPLAALDGLTLTVPDGKTCVVIGPSGCGKSTLLRVVAGLDMEYSGAVYFDERPMRDVPPRERNIGMVFQNYALYPHFEGRDNLRFFFWMHRAPDAEVEERVRITSEMMGIGFNQLLQHKPGTLSGGQQQRLAIARALVRSPQLFLFDEPLSNLDAKLRMQTRVEIKRLLQRFSITALYVTHDQEEAMALADLIAVMRAGRIVQVGAYHDLRAAPADTFVAGFLGPHPMNLLTGTLTEGGALHVAGVDVPLPDALRAHGQAGQPLTVGAWPDSVLVALDGAPAANTAQLPGTVESIEPDFARRLQYVRVRTEAGLVTGVDATNEPLAIGERVAVALPAADLYFFDAESGNRIDIA